MDFEKKPTAAQYPREHTRARMIVRWTTVRSDSRSSGTSGVRS